MKTVHAKFCKSKGGYGHYTPKCPRCGELKAGKMARKPVATDFYDPTVDDSFTETKENIFSLAVMCWLCGKNHHTADCPGADLALAGGGSGAAVVRNARHLG